MVRGEKVGKRSLFPRYGSAMLTIHTQLQNRGIGAVKPLPITDWSARIPLVADGESRAAERRRKGNPRAIGLPARNIDLPPTFPSKPLARMDFSELLFQDWKGPVRTLVVGTLGYAFLVFALRISGNRTLAKLNAFDLAVSVAFGSVFASMLLSEGVALFEGILAISLLCVLQFLLAHFSVRSKWFASLVRSEPVILVRKGEMQNKAMLGARLTKRELFAVARAHGHHDLSDIDLIILESDGGFSVISRKKEDDEEADEERSPLPMHS